MDNPWQNVLKTDMKNPAMCPIWCQFGTHLLTTLLTRWYPVTTPHYVEDRSSSFMLTLSNKTHLGLFDFVMYLEY